MKQHNLLLIWRFQRRGAKVIYSFFNDTATTEIYTVTHCEIPLDTEWKSYELPKRRFTH